MGRAKEPDYINAVESGHFEGVDVRHFRHPGDFLRPYLDLRMLKLPLLDD